MSLLWIRKKSPLAYCLRCLALIISDVVVVCRERPAVIPVEVKGIDDTSNFDDFPEVDLKLRKLLVMMRISEDDDYDDGGGILENVHGDDNDHDCDSRGSSSYHSSSSSCRKEKKNDYNDNCNKCVHSFNTKMRIFFLFTEMRYVLRPLHFVSLFISVEF